MIKEWESVEEFKQSLEMPGANAAIAIKMLHRLHSENIAPHEYQDILTAYSTAYSIQPREDDLVLVGAEPRIAIVRKGDGDRIYLTNQYGELEASGPRVVLERTNLTLEERMPAVAEMGECPVYVGFHVGGKLHGNIEGDDDSFIVQADQWDLTPLRLKISEGRGNGMGPYR